MTSRVRSAFVLGFCIFTVAFCAWLGRDVGRRSRGGSPLTISPSVLDLGIISAGESVTREFTVHNQGSRTLDIQKVVTSCGCTSAKLSRHILAPGESEQLIATFDSKGFLGPISKRIVIIPQTDECPPATASLVGTVAEKGLRLDTTTLEFGSVRFGEKFTKPLQLLGSSKQTATNLSFTGDRSENIALQWGERGIVGGVEWRTIRVVLGPIVDSPGDYNGDAKVNVGNGEAFAITVHYRVIPAISVDPISLWLTAPNWRGPLKLRSSDHSTPFRIAKVESVRHLVSVRQERSGQGYCDLRVSREQPNISDSRQPFDTVVISYWVGNDTSHLEQLGVPVFWNDKATDQVAKQP